MELKPQTKSPHAEKSHFQVNDCGKRDSNSIEEKTIMRTQYRITFGDAITNREIEQRLLMAGINTENVFGEAAMRLDASFHFDKRERVCVIDRDTEIGGHIAKLFIAYIAKEFGDDCYAVERIDADSGEAPTRWAGVDLDRSTDES